MVEVIYRGPAERYRVPREDEDLVLRRGFGEDVSQEIAEELSEIRGHQFEIDGELAEPSVSLPEEGPEDEPTALEGLTVDELHELAEENEVDIPSGAPKAVIVDALQSAGVNAPNA